MDFFKQRARQILLRDSAVPGEENFVIGKPLSLKNSYQSLKNAMKRPTVSYSNAEGNNKGYMKMTFAMSRSVAPGSKILELSKMVTNMNKQIKST